MVLRVALSWRGIYISPGRASDGEWLAIQPSIIHSLSACGVISICQAHFQVVDPKEAEAMIYSFRTRQRYFARKSCSWWTQVIKAIFGVEFWEKFVHHWGFRMTWVLPRRCGVVVWAKLWRLGRKERRRNHKQKPWCQHKCGKLPRGQQGAGGPGRNIFGTLWFLGVCFILLNCGLLTSTTLQMQEA